MRKIAALAVLALVGGCSLSSEFVDKDEPELDPTIAAVDVARDDPNREAYYLRDMHNWIDEFGIVFQEYDPDEDLLELGYTICELLDDGFEAEQVALYIEDFSGVTEFAIGVVGASVVWLCPEMIP